MRRGVLEAEVNPNGGEVALLEGVVGEPPQKRGLAHRAVADDDNLKEVIVLSNHLL